jgi:hypothetical protein
VEKQHGCESGPRCIRLAQGEDTVMEDAKSKTVVCKGCLEEKKTLILWCSQPCAEAHIAEHAKQKHEVKPESEEARSQGLVVSLEEAVMDLLQKENPGLSFSSV